MKLSIVIPVYNEVSTIQTIIEKVRNSPINPKEIIVVDDCSTDGTTLLLRQNRHNLVDKVIYHEKNQGKGAALRSGFRAVTGDVVIIQDADLEYNPSDYGNLLRPIFDGEADVVYGSRFVGGETRRVLYFWHYVGNRLITLLSNMFTNLNLSDIETCYKAFRREIIDQIEIQENRFGVEPEITAKIAELHPRIYEVGISYHGRTYEAGKKIGWKDGMRAIWCIIKYGLRSAKQRSR